jgi:hypothetical protein
MAVGRHRTEWQRGNYDSQDINLDARYEQSSRILDRRVGTEDSTSDDTEFRRLSVRRHDPFAIA